MKWLHSRYGPPDAPKYPNFVVVDQTICKDKEHMQDVLEQVQKKGGEGLMLREPKS